MADQPRPHPRIRDAVEQAVNAWVDDPADIGSLIRAIAGVYDQGYAALAVAALHQALALDPVYGAAFRRSAGISDLTANRPGPQLTWWTHVFQLQSRPWPSWSLSAAALGQPPGLYSSLMIARAIVVAGGRPSGDGAVAAQTTTVVLRCGSYPANVL